MLVYCLGLTVIGSISSTQTENRVVILEELYKAGFPSPKFKTLRLKMTLGISYNGTEYEICVHENFCTFIVS